VADAEPPDTAGRFGQRRLPVRQGACLAVEKVLRDFFQARKPPVFTGAAKVERSGRGKSPPGLFPGM